MIDAITLVICSLTLVVVAIYPLYVALMARVMDGQLAEKEPRYSQAVYQPEQTQIVESAAEQSESMLKCIRDLIVNFEWTLYQAEFLLDEPNSNLIAARATLEKAREKYGE